MSYDHVTSPGGIMSDFDQNLRDKGLTDQEIWAGYDRLLDALKEMA